MTDEECIARAVLAGLVFGQRGSHGLFYIFEPKADHIFIYNANHMRLTGRYGFKSRGDLCRAWLAHKKLLPEVA